MKNNMGNMLKQMQSNMQKAQEEFARKEVIGNSGAGLVQVTMNGKHSVIKVDIDNSLMSEAKDLVEDLVMAAVNDATQKIDSLQEESFAGFSQGLNGLKLPF